MVTHIWKSCSAFNTHTMNTPGAVGSHLCCGALGAVGGPVPCSRAPRHGIEGGESTVYSPPTPTQPTTPHHHLQSLPARDSNLQPLDYESNSITIRSLTITPVDHVEREQELTFIKDSNVSENIHKCLTLCYM